MRTRSLLLALLLTSTAPAVVAAQGVRETAAQKDARMAWWRDARFGMFIHWGLYAVPAGTWKGERITGLGEWIMERGKIPGDEYAPLTRQFNPTQFDADEWVRIAKDAGMKYIIITSKHHDGFALFDSKVSDYDIVNATPYRRDAIRALATAAQRAGLKFGVYYSIMDWHHPDAQAPGYPSYNSRSFKNPNFGRYVETYMKPQLRELVTQYPEIDVLWFDGEWIADWSDEQGRSLYDWLRGMRPGLIINNRVGHSRQGMSGMSANKDAPGDFGTPEQEVPPQGLPGIDWETCMTLNDTWGFQSFDDGWKDSRMLVRTLIDVASKGGQLPPERRAHGAWSDSLAERLAAARDGRLDARERRGRVRHVGQPVRATRLGAIHGQAVGGARVRTHLRLAQGPEARAHRHSVEAWLGLSAHRQDAARGGADAEWVGRESADGEAKRDRVCAGARDRHDSLTCRVRS